MHNLMSKTKITITIERDFPLSDEEISIAMNDIQAKLQGYKNSSRKSTKNQEILKNICIFVKLFTNFILFIYEKKLIKDDKRDKLQGCKGYKDRIRVG